MSSANKHDSCNPPFKRHLIARINRLLSELNLTVVKNDNLDKLFDVLTNIDFSTQILTSPIDANATRRYVENVVNTILLTIDYKTLSLIDCGEIMVALAKATEKNKIEMKYIDHLYKIANELYTNCSSRRKNKMPSLEKAVDNKIKQLTKDLNKCFSFLKITPNDLTTMDETEKLNLMLQLNSILKKSVIKDKYDELLGTITHKQEAKLADGLLTSPSTQTLPEEGDHILISKWVNGDTSFVNRPLVVKGIVKGRLLVSTIDIKQNYLINESDIEYDILSNRETQKLKDFFA